MGAGYQFQFASTSPDVAGFRCRLGTDAFTACTSPKVYADIANGPNRFEVEARDVAGNTTVAGVNFTVFVADTTPPTVTASPLGGTYGPATKVTLTANESDAKIYYTENGTTPTTPVRSTPVPSRWEARPSRTWPSTHPTTPLHPPKPRYTCWTM